MYINCCYSVNNCHNHVNSSSAIIVRASIKLNPKPVVLLLFFCMQQAIADNIVAERGEAGCCHGVL